MIKKLGGASLCFCAISLFLTSSLSAQVEVVERYEYDAAGNVIAIVSESQSAPPVAESASPQSLALGKLTLVTLRGDNLLGLSVASSLEGVEISTVSSTLNEYVFSVFVPGDAPLGALTLTATTALGDDTIDVEIVSEAPEVSVRPAPITVFEGESISATISEFELIEATRSVGIEVADTSVATADKGSVEITDGFFSDTFLLTGQAEGRTELSVSFGGGVTDLISVEVLAPREAPTIEWIGPENGDWGEASSWSENRVPEATDHVGIPIGGSAVIEADAQIAALTLRGTLDVSGGVLTVNGSGVSPSVANFGEFRIGTEVRVAGRMLLQNGFVYFDDQTGGDVASLEFYNGGILDGVGTIEFEGSTTAENVVRASAGQILRVGTGVFFQGSLEENGRGTIGSDSGRLKFEGEIINEFPNTAIDLAGRIENEGKSFGVVGDAGSVFVKNSFWKDVEVEGRGRLRVSGENNVFESVTLRVSTRIENNAQLVFRNRVDLLSDLELNSLSELVGRGTLHLQGELDTGSNSSKVLGGTVVVGSGTITGNGVLEEVTLRGEGSGGIAAGSVTLREGVIEGDLNLSSSRLTIRDDLELNGSLLIHAMGFGWPSVVLAGEQEVEGSGEIELIGNDDNPNFYGQVYVQGDVFNVDEKVEIGTGIEIRGDKGTIQGGTTDRIKMLGTIFGSSDGSLTISGSFANDETPLRFDTSNGPLILSGTFIGTRFQSADGSPLDLMGSVTFEGVEFLSDASWNPLQNTSTVWVKNGLTVQGKFELSPEAGEQVYVNFQGEQTIDGAGSFVFGGSPDTYNNSRFSIQSLQFQESEIVTFGEGIEILGGIGHIQSNGQDRFRFLNPIEGEEGGDLRLSGPFGNGTAPLQIDAPNGGVSLAGTFENDLIEAIDGGAVVLRDSITLRDVSFGSDVRVQPRSSINLSIYDDLGLNGDFILEAEENQTLTVYFYGEQLVYGEGSFVFGGSPASANNITLRSWGLSNSEEEMVTFAEGVQIVGGTGNVTGGSGDSFRFVEAIKGTEGGELRLRGPFGNGADPLLIDAPNGGVVLAGSFEGETLAAANGGVLAISESLTFRDARLGSDAKVVPSSSSLSLNIYDGLVLDGELRFAPEGTQSITTYFYGDQSVSGDGSVVFGGTPDASSRTTLRVQGLVSPDEEVVTFEEGIELIGGMGTLRGGSSDTFRFIEPIRGGDGAELVLQGPFANVEDPLIIDAPDGGITFVGTFEGTKFQATEGNHIVLDQTITLRDVAFLSDVRVVPDSTLIYLYIYDGLTLNSDLELAPGSGNSIRVTFYGDQAVSGAGDIRFAGSPSNSNAIQLNVQGLQFSTPEVVAFGEGIRVVGGTGKVDGGSEDTFRFAEPILGSPGGELVLEGPFANGETPIVIDAPAGGIVFEGALEDAVVEAAEGSELLLSETMTLRGVEFNGDVNVRPQGSALFLYVYDGLTLGGNMTLAPEGNESIDMYFYGEQSVQGDGALVFAGTPTSASNSEIRVQNQTSLVEEFVTFESGIEVVGGTGTIRGGSEDTFKFMEPIKGSEGGSLILTGDFENGAGSIIFDSPNGGIVLSGDVEGGTLDAVGDSILEVSSTASVDAATISDGLEVRIANGTLNVLSGLTLNGIITLEPTGTSRGEVNFQNGAQTVGGTGEFVFSGEPLINSYSELNITSAGAEADIVTIESGISVRANARGAFDGSSTDTFNFRGSLIGSESGEVEVKDFDLDGGSFLLNAPNGGFVLAGAVANATVAETEGSYFELSGSPTLDNVSLEADIKIQSASLTIENGLTLNGSILLEPEGNQQAKVRFAEGAQSIDGNGEFIFGGDPLAQSYSELDIISTGSDADVVTLGSGIRLRANALGSLDGSATDTFKILGTLVGSSTGEVHLEYLDLDGESLELDAPNGGFVLNNNIVDAILNGTEGSFFSLGSSVDFDGLTVNTDLQLESGNLYVRNGLALNGALRLAPTGSQTAYVRFSGGAQTVSGTGEIMFGGTPTSTSNNRLQIDSTGGDADTVTLGADIDLLVSSKGRLTHSGDDLFTIEGGVALGTVGELLFSGDWDFTSVDWVFDVAGTGEDDFGFATVTGAAEFGGSLELQSVDSFIPLSSDTFELISFSSATGDIATVTGPPVSGFEYDVEVDATDKVVRAILTAE